eukprot:15454929-Alexandrium_andersonii.AAC.1
MAPPDPSEAGRLALHLLQVPLPLCLPRLQRLRRTDRRALSVDIDARPTLRSHLRSTQRRL